MKIKTFCISLLAMLLASSLCAGQLTVLKPNGGESWTLGRSNMQISWSAAGVSENVRISLLMSGKLVGTIADNLPPGSSPFLWTAGKLADGTMVPAGSDYKVRVHVSKSNELTKSSDLSKSSDSDESDGPFSLVNLTHLPPLPLPELQLLKPTGGETLWLHQETEIAWKWPAHPAGKVRLQLMRVGYGTIGILADDLPATGTFTWKAGEYPGNTAPAGKYLIRVSSMTDVKIYSESSAFDLTSPLDVLPNPKLAEQLKKQYTFTPVITNGVRKIRNTHYTSDPISGDPFMGGALPNIEEPGPGCCRIGWVNDCDSYQDSHWVFRSHLALDVSTIPATAKVTSARLTWSEDRVWPFGERAIHLYKLNAPWNGDPGALFTIACIEVDRNHLQYVVQEWVKRPGTNYGLVLVGDDETMDCDHGKKLVRVLCSLKLEVETLP